MSMHAEWDSAESCGVEAATAEVINADWALPDVVDAPAALVLGGDGGGCLVVEGTPEQLRRFAERVRAAVANLSA